LDEIMCDKELLVSYLYDDLAAGDRAAFESHLRACAACRDELNALRGVRADLISWTPPQPDFGFRVVREPKVVPMPARSWRAWYTPAAGLAAAAVLVLAAASAIAHVEIHRGPDGVTVRTGWSASASAASASAAPDGARGFGGTRSPATANVSPASSAPSTSVDPALVAAIVRRLDALEASARESSNVRNASTMSARVSDAELFKRMREIVAQSESKQQGELALRIAQVIRDVDAQRVADLSQIQQGMRGIQRTVNDEAIGHRELTNYILASSKQK
jgi:hypothetical protein